MIVGEIRADGSDVDSTILYASVAILLLAISNFIIRYASNKYPSEQEKIIKNKMT
jgi:phosphate starvation-inducible membrane PsiE